MNWELFWFALPRTMLMVPVLYIAFRIATYEE